jgi:nucleoid-associated protein YgaU
MAALIFLTFSGVYAQNLLTENKYYREAQELTQQAQEALEAGEYDRAAELAEKAQNLSTQAESYAELQLKIYKARGWKNRAEDYISWARGTKAEERFPEKWKKAAAAYEEAEDFFESERWKESIEASKRTIALVEEIEPRSTKPRYYEVRLIPGNRDCFWKIAGYDFVYGDPFKWKKLYEENKEKLPRPNNPDLILPGMTITIPSISGERRSGTWEP